MQNLTVVTYPYLVSEVLSVDSPDSSGIASAVEEYLRPCKWITSLFKGRTEPSIKCIISEEGMIPKPELEKNNPLHDERYSPPESNETHLAELIEHSSTLLVLAHRSTLSVLVLYGWALIDANDTGKEKDDDNDLLRFVKSFDAPICPVLALMSTHWRSRIDIVECGDFTSAIVTANNKKRKSPSPLEEEMPDSRRSHIAIEYEQEGEEEEPILVSAEMELLASGQDTALKVIERLFAALGDETCTRRYVDEQWNSILHRIQPVLFKRLVEDSRENEEPFLDCLGMLLFFYPTEPWSTYELHALACWLLPTKIRQLAEHLDLDVPEVHCCPWWAASWTSYCGHFFATTFVAPMLGNIMSKLADVFTFAPARPDAAKWLHLFLDISQSIKDQYRHLLAFRLIEPLSQLSPLGLTDSPLPLDSAVRPGLEYLTEMATYVPNKFVLFPKPPITSVDALAKAAVNNQAKPGPSGAPDLEAHHLLPDLAPGCLQVAIAHYRTFGVKFSHVERNLLMSALLKVGECVYGVGEDLVHRTRITNFVMAWMKEFSVERFDRIANKTRDKDNDYGTEIRTLIASYLKEGKIFYRRCINQPNPSSTSTGGLGSTYTCPHLPQPPSQKRQPVNGKATETPAPLPPPITAAVRRDAVAACGKDGVLINGIADIEQSPYPYYVWWQRSKMYHKKIQRAR